MTKIEQLCADPDFRFRVERGDGTRKLCQAFPGFNDIMIRRAVKRVRASLGLPPTKSVAESLRDAQYAVHPAASSDDALEAALRRIAVLQEQLTWAQRSSVVGQTGGKATINVSDLHLGDRAHTPRCYRQMWDKSITVLRQYNPKEICVVVNGDAVAGRGIYKEQNTDSILQLGTDQIKVAAFSLWEIDQRLSQEHPLATREWRILSGNHDKTLGEPLAPALVLQMRLLGVQAIYCGDSAVLNLAGQGTYNAYFEHGYGYSQISPSSPKWLNAMLEKIISLYRRGYDREGRIRRICHGHTHWFSVGLERITDVYFDTTGGCQRNERVLLGKNQRPQGFIIYVSPEGCVDSILEPIGIQPDPEVSDADHSDPYLFQRNARECMEALEMHDRLVRELGIVKTMEPEGR